MIMRGHLYSTKTKAKIKKGNKTKRNKIQWTYSIYLHELILVFA